MPRTELLAPLLLILAGAAPAPHSGVVAWVTDGDTFRLKSGERIRIAGIDAPETQPGNARCRAELARGKAATRAAIALLKGRGVEIERVGRSYDRTVARIRLNGRDVAALLVEKGAARWWPRGKPKPSWCGR
ncbi:thermonuclease family protein [Sphingomonas psychrotolerans]|uniref:Thermonuclease family protein n=1 Tax=Sphingomonas psychrotolerans TaxID=1327635 RepID=A0ABU3N7T2_9SPHN|nr:thermonuclease family protein [Sphingomonas psychrotolerans]MDT8760559.1 thermonuclease family protein [Sphingomonas psychrotolerans]